MIESTEWDLKALFRSEEQLERFMSSLKRNARQVAKAYEGRGL